METMRSRIPGSTALCVLVGAALSASVMGEESQVFDTGAPSSTAWAPDALAARSGWTTVPEGTTAYAFKGDAAVANGKLLVVLRRQGRGAEVYGLGPQGPVLRGELIAVGAAPATAFGALAILQNEASAVALEATFGAADDAALVLRYEIEPGQAFVRLRPRAGVTGVRIAAPCRFAVLPDFFAADIVIDAAAFTGADAELPSDNFLMHMAGEGEAIVMAAWHPAKEDTRLAFAQEAGARRIASADIRVGNDGMLCVAVLEQPGIWHVRDVAAADAGKILDLGWKPPYTAHWRVDWRCDDGLTDSWEMLTQGRNGEFVKHGWYGQAESFGNVDWLKENRERWTTVLGTFLYPCWVDKDGAAFLQPLKKVVRFQGPALIYPITRIEATPLEALTIVDVMRATLGVGPCEYVLDVEGQKKTYEGRPTCASRTILNGIYAAKEQTRKKAEVLKTLDEVSAFVRHIRGRIEAYLEFGRATAAYLDGRKKADPAEAKIADELSGIVRRMEEYAARRKDGVKTPEFAAALVEEFRTTLVDYEGADALAKCKRITAALVDIGGNQDELVGECRMVVKILRQRAAMAAAADARMATLAREVRNRTQQMLRNPTSYEAPRH